MSMAVSSNPLRHRWVVRHRGFVLIPQNDLSWPVYDVKALIDWRMNQAA